MADSNTKTHSAAEKAFAEASEKKIDEAASAKPAVDADAIAKAVAAPAKTSTPSKPASPKKSAKPAKQKKKAATKSAKRVAKAEAPKPTPNSKMKDNTMATANTADTRNLNDTVKNAAANAKGRLKGAVDKGTEMTAETVAFQKGNLEALVESGKVFASGLQNMGRDYVEDTRAAIETAQDDVRKMAAVKSPTELFQLQGEIARRNFDSAVATVSKNSEAFLKLANEAFAPMSSRMSLAAEKFSKAA